MEVETAWLEVVNPSSYLYSDIKTKTVTTCKERQQRFILRAKAWEPIRKPDGAKRYITKYVLKAQQKNPPEWFVSVGRFWGKTKGLPIETPKTYLVNHSAGVEAVKAVNAKVGEWDVIPRTVLRFDKDE